MPPAPRIRLLVEKMIREGKTPKQIGDRAQDLGFGRDYAMQIYRGLTSIVTHGVAAFPDREAHAKHLQALYDANGSGFVRCSDAVMKRFYLLERSPPRAPAFWRGEVVVRGVA